MKITGYELTVNHGCSGKLIFNTIIPTELKEVVAAYVKEYILQGHDVVVYEVSKRNLKLNGTGVDFNS